MLTTLSCAEIDRYADWPTIVCVLVLFACEFVFGCLRVSEAAPSFEFITVSLHSNEQFTACLVSSRFHEWMHPIIDGQFA